MAQPKNRDLPLLQKQLIQYLGNLSLENTRNISVFVFYSFHTQRWKMAKHIFKILQCEHIKIFKVFLSIIQHYTWKYYSPLNQVK